MSQNPAALRARGMKRRTNEGKDVEAMQAWQDFVFQLREARIRRGLTHKQLADGIGVTLGQISGWERTVAAPHPHDLMVWMQYLGLAPTTKPIG